MIALAMIFGGVIGAFVGALAVALAAAADRRPSSEPARVHLYHPNGTSSFYKILTVYPGQVLSIRGVLEGAPPNEPASPFGRTN